MGNPTSTPASTPTILATGLALVDRHTASIPPGKTAAVVVAAEWRYGVPVALRFGVAKKVGESWKFGVEAETRFKKNTEAATVYTAWAW